MSGQLSGPGVELGLGRERAAQLRLDAIQSCRGCGLGRRRLRAPPLRRHSGVAQPAALGFEARARGLRILERAAAILEIALQLRIERPQPGPVGGQARHLVADRAPALAEPRQLGRQGRFALAQAIELRRGVIARGAGFAQALRAHGNRRAALPQDRLRGGQLVAREAPAADEQRRLDLAMCRAQLPIALGFARLLAQVAMLLAKRDQQVLDPEQIVLGRLELELGLVAPGLQAADPGSFLEQPPPLGRLGIHQRADLPLAHDRGAAGAGCGIREQHLDVARPQLLAVHPEHRARAAADPPGQLELIDLPEPGHHECRATQMELDLGEIERRPRRGAGEDHVVHLAAAQPARRGLAHHPAQRVDQIRLAAAVGPDDAGQARLDQQVGRVPERLEATEAQFGDLHRLRAWGALTWVELYQRNAHVEKPNSRISLPRWGANTTSGPKGDAGTSMSRRAAGRSGRRTPRCHATPHEPGHR